MASTAEGNFLLALWAGLLTVVTGWNHISIRGQGRDLAKEVRRCDDMHITKEDFKNSMDRLESTMDRFSGSLELLTRELMKLSINYSRDKEDEK